MHKILLLGFLMVFFLLAASAQKPVVDSLKRAYQKDGQDTTLVKVLDVKSVIVFGGTNTDSAMICARQGLAISRRIHYTYGEVRSLANIATYLNVKGDLPGALRTTFEVLPKAIAINETYTIAQSYNTLGLAYYTLKDFEKSILYYHKALPYAQKTGIYEQVFTEENNLARDFFELNRLDSAQWYTDKAFALATKKKLLRHIGLAIRNYGIIQFKKGNYQGAIGFYNQSLAQKASQNNHNFMSEDLRLKAETYQKLNKPDSCIEFAKLAYEQAKLERSPRLQIAVAALLTTAYQSKNDFKEAFVYQQLMQKAQDSLFSQQKALQIHNVEFNEQQRQEEIKAAEASYRNRIRFYTLFAVIVLFVLIAAFLLYTSRSRKKANAILQQTLAELKSTQGQLIQSAKMASLGELTAGIAHEIQNPLNFVNNFSEVSLELMEELKQEAEKGDIEEVKAIASDVIGNLGKVTQHGKRADNIVKGMLEHSRTSTGQKEATDVNKLAEENLKLAYHGFRAKNKDFNTELKTDFDKTLNSLQLIPQDIGRVLLNLFNNAFYAVNQKTKAAGPKYQPAVSVTTALENGRTKISVTDNGTGIPENVREKIMQPFFTTKPTGEGTGLGLSLSYDIIKAHGGSIEVATKEGEFSSFTIIL